MFKSIGKAANKAIVRTQTTLRFVCAAQLGRYAQENLMKSIGLLLSLMVFGISYCYGQFNPDDFVKQQKENIEFNATVTDKEIIDFLKFQYEIEPDMLKQLRDIESDPGKRKTFISNYRKSHNDAGMRLGTLKGLSEKEIGQLRMVFEYKKKEHYEAIDAEKRLQKFSKDQLAIVVKEGAKLIESYESLKQESSDSTVKIISNFPKSLDFLKLQLIYLTDTNCSIFLQKGIGKGVGFSVSKENGEWKLRSFNEYKSWDRQDVELQ